MNKVTVNLDKLREIRAEIARLPSARVKVGVLGDRNARPAGDGAGLSNSEIGAIHEFGTKASAFSPAEKTALQSAGLYKEGQAKRRGIPARSFLRMPLLTRLPNELYALGRAVWGRIVADRGMLVALKDLGVLAENIVQRAFETGGWGQWAPLSPVTIRRKKSSAILIDKGFLRKSVTSAVVNAKQA